MWTRRSRWWCADLGEVGHRGAVHRGELSADVGVGGQFIPLNATELTVPLTFGFHEVTVNGAEKLKSMFRA
jgi:hypothetical protein